MKDEEKISRILASLDTIEAPKNFEGLVRTRIAERPVSESTERRLRLRISLIARFEAIL